MTVNVDLLTKTLAHIEAHPETWYQEDWRVRTDCGTACCFAGWAATLDGCVWYVRDDDLAEDDLDGWAELITIGGATVGVGEHAAKILGLSRYDADRLFDGGNNLTALRRIVGELIAGAA